MKTFPCQRLCLGGTVSALILAFLAASPLQAQSRKKNPTSKVYVAEVSGTAQIDTGETIDDLTRRSVYNAQGTVIETKEDSTNAMVWSNGTGIYFAPDTRLEVKRFVQEPFIPNRNDMEVEPSISRTETFMPRGAVGLCTSKLVAGSTMTYNTPHASVRLKGRKAVIEVANDETIVSLLEGDITVRAGERDRGGQILEQGQQAIIKRDGTITIRPIPDTQMKSLDDMVAMACMARKSVYFDAKDQEDPTDGDVTAFGDTGDTVDNIEVIEVIPPKLPPVITVSAAAIPQPE
ncbi:MAG TPA: hypothetical protein PLF88_00025 [Opitutaceae bacterium]|nr:hypothetical protein [Opitutaceae bacterium]HRJ45819.1 hypothetical protein [Opitutaceae bacterium]